jgi:hypothetical protein
MAKKCWHQDDKGRSTLSGHFRTDSDDKKKPVISCDKCGMEWTGCSCGKKH